jgi:hypothetical protein
MAIPCAWLKPVGPERLTQAVERARRLNAFTDQKAQERATLMRVARGDAQCAAPRRLPQA